jgi:hypothetical protein
MSKTYFVVRNVANINDGVQVATGDIPGTSPALFTGGDTTSGNYYFYKVPAGGTAPTGASVVELTVDEAQVAVQSELFNGGVTTAEFIAKEQEVAQRLRAEFMVAQASLDLTSAEALFTALESTSHALSAGSLNIAYFRFNNASVDQATKDAFNPLFENFFRKFPRNLT